MANQTTSVETNNLVVTGGSSTVKVNVDFGPIGNRGALILYGVGKPTDAGITFPQEPQLLDWYINIKTTDSEYLYIYQYQNRDSVNQWIRVFRLTPNIYNTNETAIFVNGQAIVNVFVSNTTLPLLSTATLPQLNTHVDINTTTGYPIASSFVLGDYEIVLQNGLPVGYTLPIYLSAAQLNPTNPLGWEPLQGQTTAHISINVI